MSIEQNLCKEKNAIILKKGLLSRIYYIWCLKIRLEQSENQNPACKNWFKIVRQFIYCCFNQIETKLWHSGYHVVLQVTVSWATWV